MTHWRKGATPIDGQPPPSLQEIMSDTSTILTEMNDRSREVFRRVVESYLNSGDPVGSRTLTRTMSEKLSAATIRNTMQDLEFLGLLDSPHVSAGRIPTQLGLRMFVDGLMEVGTIDDQDRAKIESSMGRDDGNVTSLLDQVGAALSGITRSASLVLAPKQETAIKHIEFVSLSPDRALVVLVFADGHVENRLFAPPPGQTPSSMREAANFLNAIAEGRRLSELRPLIAAEIARHRQPAEARHQQSVDYPERPEPQPDCAEQRRIAPAHPLAPAQPLIPRAPPAPSRPSTAPTSTVNESERETPERNQHPRVITIAPPSATASHSPPSLAKFFCGAK